ncbi:MAG: HNH endonuclease [Marinilabiliaceae bacterium]|nr:HNH endonuclease [Marinilabiliaceae bacterium]
MPTRPERKPRPWEPQPNTEAHARRVNPNAAFYNSPAWRRLRVAYLRIHPLCECEVCAKADVPMPAEMVDHITPINQGGDPLDWSNLQAMSNKHHNQKSARESHGIFQKP